MLKDDKYFERIRSGEAPQLPSALANFVGQTLCNHYEDTVRSPLTEEMQRHIDALPDARQDPESSDEAPAGEP